jgi:DNA-binding NarL/FixJ family response regulator
MRTHPFPASPHRYHGPRAPLSGAWRRPARVVLIGSNAHLEARLSKLTDNGVPVRLVAVEADLWSGLAAVASQRPDAVLYALDEVEDGLAGLSLLRAEEDDVRLVVMSNRVDLLEDALEIGADVWIAGAADDGTVAAALTGSRDAR